MKMKFTSPKQLIQDLKDWQHEENRKQDRAMLSRFMNELDKGELSDETKRWWLNRY
jgi:hypothetical protein